MRSKASARTSRPASNVCVLATMRTWNGLCAVGAKRTSKPAARTSSTKAPDNVSPLLGKRPNILGISVSGVRSVAMALTFLRSSPGQWAHRRYQTAARNSQGDCWTPPHVAVIRERFPGLKSAKTLSRASPWLPMQIPHGFSCCISLTALMASIVICLGGFVAYTSPVQSPGSGSNAKGRLHSCPAQVV